MHTLMKNSQLAEEITHLHAEICSALGDPNRIMMLYVLAEQPHNVSDLAAKVGVSQPAASRHLKLLRQRGLVNATRKGTSVEYDLRDERLIQALDLLRNVLYERLSHRANLMREEVSAHSE